MTDHQVILLKICYNCNMGERNLPDMHAQNPKGIHTHKVNDEYPCYKHHESLSLL